MSIWQPEADETLIARAPVTFATGEATPVSGMRWFRDTQRNDIQDELAGWPAGPTYTARSTGDTAARNTAKGALAVVGVAIKGFLSSHGGSIGGTPGLAGNGTDTSHDHADEVNDLLAYLLSRGDKNSPMFKK